MLAMKSRLIAACIAAIVVLPSSALATNSPEVTYPTGTKLATETKLRAVNVGEPKLTLGATTVTCSSSQLEGKLTKNTGEEVEATIEAASFTGGDCSHNGGQWTAISTAPKEHGIPWCLRSTPEHLEHEVQIRGGKCSEVSAQPIRLEVNTQETKVVFECVYERSAAVPGTYQTHPGDTVLTSNNVEFLRVAGNIVICPASMKIDTSFTFEKEEGSAGPLYTSAGPRLTFPTGTTLATGSKVRGTSVGSIKMTTSTGTVECTSGEVTGTVKKNSGTEIEADIESAAFTGICSSPLGNVSWTFKPATNGLPWCLRATSAMAVDAFQIRGNNCASASRPIRMFSEQFATFTSLECLYERSAPLSGTYTTHPEDAVLKFNNATFLEVEPKKGSCPDEAQLDSSMTLEQKVEGKPLYIS